MGRGKNSRREGVLGREYEKEILYPDRYKWRHRKRLEENKMKLYVGKIEERNFHNAYAKAIHIVLREGADLVIGGAEQRKPIKDSCMLISLEGEAIRQIERRELHPQFPTGKKHLDKYCEEFTNEFLDEYEKRSEAEKFAYLYFKRLIAYPAEGTYTGITNQLYNLYLHLKSDKDENITSNRQQAITWIPKHDFSSYDNPSPPCLQRIQIRYIPKDKVDIHLTWRSRDLYAAWQSNIICIINMLNREVIKPNNCQIARIIDFSDSLHIYKTDIEEAKKVKLVPISPQEI